MPFLLRYHYSKVSSILRSLPHKNTKKKLSLEFPLNFKLLIIMLTSVIQINCFILLLISLKIT